MGEARGAGRLSRRRLIGGGAVALGGAVTGGGAVAAAGALTGRLDGGTGAQPGTVGTVTVPFHGTHQAGIATPPQAHAVFLGFDLVSGVDRAALGRLMRILTDDAARLTQGQPALADGDPDLATLPARLTVTFGFGPGLFRAAGLDDHRPASVAPLPGFAIDRLDERWSGGDLLAQVCCDDTLTLAHAQRMLVKDARAFATLRWAQRGFRRSPGVRGEEQTQRNVLGQLDGTANPRPGTRAFDEAVWISDATGETAWLRGGTTLVLRRIRAELERWDAVDREGKEFAIGRRLDTGAPLTGSEEHDPVDLAATDDLGFLTIPEYAHIRRAHVGEDRLRIFRRVYNYDEAPAAGGAADAGLLFAAYQADVARQFLPIQRNLAELDMLNEWTTPTGSAVFAVPPGCAPGGWIGETLLG